MDLKALLRDPLLHFLALGAIVYGGIAWADDTQDRETITVDRTAMLEYVQFKTKAFDDDYAQEQLDTLSPAELQQLIGQYGREEMLYREAQKLGLDKGDFIIRQRLLGKMTYLTQGGQTPPAPTEEQLSNYLAENSERYSRPPSATLTHVFLAGDQADAGAPKRRAEQILAQLNARSIAPEAAGEYGDSYIYARNYVQADAAQIGSQLGADVARAALSADNPTGQWFGPVTSNRGEHLLFVLERKQQTNPILSAVREEVERDFLNEARAELSLALEEEIGANYRIIIADDLQSATSEQAAGE